MPATEFLRQLDRTLSPADVALVTAALRQDTLVWDSLMQPSFASQALTRLGGTPGVWNPGRLGLLTLGDPMEQDALRGEPLTALPPSFQEKALQVYQYTQRTGALPSTLRDACLLALALRERRRLTGSWAGLLDEILPRAQGADAHPFAMWRTALACLYTLVPDPDAMLRALLPKAALKEPNGTRITGNTAFGFIVHARLCQPSAIEEHSGALMPLLHGLNVVGQLALLRELSLRGGQALAASLASGLLIGHPAFANLRAQGTATDLDLPGLGSRALALQHLGAFYQLAGDHNQALELFDAAESALEQWMGGLTLQRISLRGRESSGIVAAEQARRLAPVLPWLKNDLGAVIISLPCDCEAFDIPENAYLQLKRAAGQFEQEPALARDLARQGCAGILAQIAQGDLPFSGPFVYDWYPQDLLTILLNMGLLEEARQMADALIAMRPNDTDLLHISSRIYEQLGLSRQAIRAARSLAALQPQEAAWRRRLGRLYGQANLWEAALEQWRAVLEINTPPFAADRLQCADAAFHINGMEEAAAQCEGILAEDSNNGAAAGLLGQALVAQGKHETAQNWLQRATQLAPEIPAPWLALARLQREMGEPQQALDTLRGAVTALPESAEAQLALGEACLMGEMPTEALPHLKQAFLLAPDMPQVALMYGRALRTLGHSRQARSALEQVRSAWQSSPELAYEMALVLLDMDEPESALPVLEMALRGSSCGNLPVLDASLIYVKILLGEFNGSEQAHPESGCGADTARMQQAEQALHRILEMAPESVEAQFLMADLLRERGDLVQALEIYRELSDQTNSADPDLRWRIQWGLGRTALRLGQYETALVALKEAAQHNTESMPLQRTLSEASLRAGLPSEALQAASCALQLAPADVENLAWFASFAGGLGETRRAVEALERAVQIEPDQSALRVALAEWQLSAGDLDAARASLGSLADLEEATANDLRRAAHVYLRLGDSAAALACYDQAIALHTDAPKDLLFEAAQLHERQGSLESALDLSHRAQDENIRSLPVYRFQADLLARMNRPQAAMALLEEALRIAQVDEKAAGTVHESIARLMVQQGNLPVALHHMERALECSPENASLAYRAADLALSLLQTERAGRILRAYTEVETDLTGMLMEQGAAGLDLLCLKIELVLASERTSEVELELQRWMEQGLAFAPGYPRLAAAKARMLARRGAHLDAQRWYELALSAWKKTGALGTPAPWLANAALDLHRWQDALIGFERWVLTSTAEARAQVQLARALTLAAEYQRTCEILGFHSGAPGPNALSESSRKKHEACITAASKQAGSAEIGRWQVRGQAAFTPTAQTARGLALLPSSAEDSTALAAVLRQINNPTAALQMARKYMHTPEALLQMALCCIVQPNDEGETIAQSAVDAAPGQPLPLSAMAKIRFEYGDMEGALDAYEEALRLAPEEPEWHDAAGDLCIRLGRLPQAVDHRRRAAELELNNARYAFKLGQACLTGDDLSEAIASLEKSCTLDPKQAESWLALAGAYQMAGRLPQALEAARTAGTLDPTAAEGLLIAGETALAMDQPELALEYARQAAQREPANAGAVLFLSSTLALLDKAQEALTVIEEAPAEVRQSFPVAFERAKLIRLLFGAKQVLDVLEKLVKEFPEEPGLLGIYATVLAECGDTKTAERIAFKSLRIDPNQPELTLMLGRLQRKTGQLDQAVHLLSEAIRMEPDNLEAYLELAGVYQERREATQALHVYKQAMQIRPDDYRACYQSGLILRECKDYSGAEGMLRKAAELAPDNSSIRRQLVAVIALNLVHQNNKQPA